MLQSYASSEGGKETRRTKNMKAGKIEGKEESGGWNTKGASNYEPCPRVHRELKWPVQFLVQNNGCVPNRKTSNYEALLKFKNQEKNTQ